MRLLSRTFQYYFILTAGVLVIGGFTFYFLIGQIFYKQIDEDLNTEKDIIADEIENNSHIPDYSARFGHQIEVLLLDKPGKIKHTLMDTLMDHQDGGARYRYLYFSNNYSGGRSYVIRIFHPLDDTMEIIEGIMVVMLVMFSCLFLALISVNFLISRKIWVPFYKTIRQLNKYNLNGKEELEMPDTTIYEFNVLNNVLRKMAEKISQDFNNMKEFTENASHEIQTPLAIIKTKIEMLVQQSNHEKGQMEAIQTINEAVTRLSKLNSGLLLLSKIDNSQFSETRMVDLVPVFISVVAHLDDLIQLKNIKLDIHFSGPFEININPELSEVLIGNLISNAIKHNIEVGFITLSSQENSIIIQNSGLPLQVKEELLFNRFVKNNHASKSLGLGMAMIKKICELYNLDYTYKCLDRVHTFVISKTN